MAAGLLVRIFTVQRFFTVLGLSLLKVEDASILTTEVGHANYENM